MIRDDVGKFFDALVAFLPRLAFGTIIFIIALLLAIGLTRLFRNRLVPQSHDPLLVNFLARIVRIVFIVVGLALALRAMGLGGIAGSLIAGAGITAFVIGFAFKDIGENFLSGIILAFKRPFNVGDTIQSDDIRGYVEEIDLRVTHIKTQDGTDVYIPNSSIVKLPLYNFTRGGSIRNSFSITINYWNDFEHARAVILQALSETEGLSTGKPGAVTIEELTKDGIKLLVYYWVDLFVYKGEILELKGKVTDNVQKALQGNGFIMPVPAPMPSSGIGDEDKPELVK